VARIKEEQTMTREELIKTLVDDWHSGIVLRKDFARFSGGAFAAGTVANADSRGPDRLVGSCSASERCLSCLGRSRMGSRQMKDAPRAKVGGKAA
jgi:hypothetical protein